MEIDLVKLYVGNLPWSIADAELENLFAEIGPVQSAQVIMDRDSGRSRGFGFVEMEQSDGNRAIAELNGREVDSRALRVSEAQSKQSRASGF